MELLSADATLLKKIIIAHENMKNCPQKMHKIGPNFFFSTALSCPYGQKLIIHIGNWAVAPCYIYFVIQMIVSIKKWPIEFAEEIFYPAQLHESTLTVN